MLYIVAQWSAVLRHTHSTCDTKCSSRSKHASAISPAMRSLLPSDRPVVHMVSSCSKGVTSRRGSKACAAWLSNRSSCEAAVQCSAVQYSTVQYSVGALR